MKKIIFTLFIFVILSTSVLNSFALSTEETSSLKAFEYNYTNYAWSYTNEGWYITHHGDIVKYSETGGNYSETKIGKVNKYILSSNLKLLSKCSENNLSKKEYVGADMGQTSCKGYINSKEILLNTTGDYNQYNLAPESKIIVGWLKTINLYVKMKSY